MACAEVEHAVQVAMFGPLAPVRMLTKPEHILMIAPGMKNGETLFGPRSLKLSCWRSIRGNPPMPDPMTTPTRVEFSSVISRPDCSSAIEEAARA